MSRTFYNEKLKTFQGVPNAGSEGGDLYFDEVAKRLIAVNANGDTTEYESSELVNYGVSVPTVGGITTAAPGAPGTLSASGSRSVLSSTPHPSNYIDYLWLDDDDEVVGTGALFTFEFPQPGSPFQVKVHGVDRLFNVSEPNVITLVGDANATAAGKTVIPFSHTFPSTVFAGESGEFEVIPGTNSDGEYYELELTGNNAVTLTKESLLFPGRVGYVISRDPEHLSIPATVTIFKIRTGERVHVSLDALIKPPETVRVLSETELTLVGETVDWYEEGDYPISLTAGGSDGVYVEYSITGNGVEIINGEGLRFSEGEDAIFRVTGAAGQTINVTATVTDVHGDYETVTFIKTIRSSPSILVNAMSMDLSNDILGSAPGTFNFTPASGGVAPLSYHWETVEVTNNFFPIPGGTMVTKVNYPNGEAHPMTLTGQTNSTVDYTISGNPGYYGCTAYLKCTVTDSLGNKNYKTFEVAGLDDHAIPILPSELVITTNLVERGVTDRYFNFAVNCTGITRNGINFTPDLWVFSNQTCYVNSNFSNYPLTNGQVYPMELFLLPGSTTGQTYGMSISPNLGNFKQYIPPTTFTNNLYADLSAVDVFIPTSGTYTQANATRLVSPPVNVNYTWNSYHADAANWVAYVDESKQAIRDISTVIQTPISKNVLFKTVLNPFITYPFQPYGSGKHLAVKGTSFRVMLSVHPFASGSAVTNVWPNEGSDWTLNSYYLEVWNLSTNVKITDTVDLRTYYEEGSWVKIRGLPANGSDCEIRVFTDVSKSGTAHPTRDNVGLQYTTFPFKSVPPNSGDPADYELAGEPVLSEIEYRLDSDDSPYYEGNEAIRRPITLDFYRPISSTDDGPLRFSKEFIIESTVPYLDFENGSPGLVTTSFSNNNNVVDTGVVVSKHDLAVRGTVNGVTADIPPFWRFETSITTSPGAWYKIGLGAYSPLNTSNVFVDFSEAVNDGYLAVPLFPSSPAYATYSATETITLFDLDAILVWIPGTMNSGDLAIIKFQIGVPGKMYDCRLYVELSNSPPTL